MASPRTSILVEFNFDINLLTNASLFGNFSSINTLSTALQADIFDFPFKIYIFHQK